MVGDVARGRTWNIYGTRRPPLQEKSPNQHLACSHMARADSLANSRRNSKSRSRDVTRNSSDKSQ